MNAPMKTYRARQNEILDGNKQVAIVLAVNCSRKMAARMAAYCAQQLNHEERDKQRQIQRAKEGAEK